ncbi:MAG TPA: hypothetical protein VN081_06560 [Dongiaceae bacterium]|nr:hypothetical protein [Dongiaceae bacterium]
MSKEKETPEAKDEFDGKVSQRVIALAGKLQGMMKGTNTGLITGMENAYEENLPEGLTMKHVKLKDQYDRDMNCATRLAQGRVSIPLMEEHPNITETTVEFQGGAATFGGTFYREHKVPDGKDSTKTVYGHHVAYYEAPIDSSKGAMRAIASHLNTLAAKALGKEPVAS